MRGQDLLEQMGLVDAAFVEEAEKKHHRTWPRILAVAACLCLAVVACVWFYPSPETPIDISHSNGEEEPSIEIYTENAMPEPNGANQDYLGSMQERWADLYFEGKVYSCTYSSISPELLEEELGKGVCEGYDWQTQQQVSFSVPVYAIEGTDSRLLVAIPLEDGCYYVYHWSDYAPPATLGELMHDFDLENTLDLFSLEIGSDFYGYLYEDDGLWELLRECKDAPLVVGSDLSWVTEDRLNIMLDSETLGISFKALEIHGAGYLLLTVYDWSAEYEIGRAAAQRIIQYAWEHSEKVE